MSDASAKRLHHRAIVALLSISFASLTSAQTATPATPPTKPATQSATVGSHEGDFNPEASSAALTTYIFTRAQRLASERRRAAQAALPPAKPGEVRCDSGGGFLITRDLLTDDQWRIFVTRALQSLASDDLPTQLAGLHALHHIEQAGQYYDPTAAHDMLTDAQQQSLFTLLTKLSSSKDGQISTQATYLLATSLVASQPLAERLDPILKKLRATDLATQRDALTSLSNLLYSVPVHSRDVLGPQAADVIAALRSCAQSTDARQGKTAILAMGQLGRAGAPVVGELTTIVQQQGAPHRRVAARALEQLGPVAAPAAPAMIALLESADEQSIMCAIRVLAAVGEEAKPAVPRLSQLLDDPREGIPTLAARTLLYIGPSAIEALPRLQRELLHDPDCFGGFGKVAAARLQGGELPASYRRPWEE